MQPSYVDGPSMEGYVNILSGPALEEVTEQTCVREGFYPPVILFSRLPHPILFQALKGLANLHPVLPRTVSILS